MTPAEVGAIVGIIVGVVGLFTLIWKMSAWVQNNVGRLDQLERRVGHLLKLSSTEAMLAQERAGLIQHSSPYRQSDEFYDKYSDRIDEDLGNLMREIAEEYADSLPPEEILAMIVAERIGWEKIVERANVLELSVTGYLAQSVAKVNEEAGRIEKNKPAAEPKPESTDGQGWTA